MGATMGASALVLLAVALLSGAHAQFTGFPYCACYGNTPGQSNPLKAPYLMTLDSDTPVSNGHRVCWKLVTVNPDATGRCTRYDLRKIEFNIKTNCRGTVKDLTFNGVTLSTSYTAYPGLNALTFKVERGPRGSGILLGTYNYLSKQDNFVCYTLTSPCSDIPDFCTGGPNSGCTFVFFNPDDKCCLGNGNKTVARPPHPPPPPPPQPHPNNFPCCKCTRNVPTPTYSLTPLSSSVDKGLNKFCWNLNVNKAAGDAPCTAYDLKKIEINVAPSCDRHSISYMTFNNQPISTSYATCPQGALTLKITRGTRPLGLYSQLAAGSPTPLCIWFNPASNCPKPSSYCDGGECTAAFFSTDNACCPLETVPPLIG